MIILELNTEFEKEGDRVMNLKEFKVENLEEGTYFGIVLSGQTIIDGKFACEGEFFSRANPKEIGSYGQTAVFIRKGWKGKSLLGSVEEIGDVKYIDGCTDSLLVCPPRKGDPCLNSLYFPKNTNQTFHTHPSQRLGAVLSGEGYACLEDKEIKLEPGTVFLIETNEVHRFRTENSEMVVIAYHPDSDWGPTDEEHPMINKTIIK